MCNDEFKELCRAAGEDEECFFFTITDKKGKQRLKKEIEMKKKNNLFLQKAHQKQIPSGKSYAILSV